MTEKPFKVWGHPKVFENSLTGPNNGWLMLGQFEKLQTAERHVEHLSKDDSFWRKIKAYRIEETIMVGKQIDVGRDSFIKAYVDPLKPGGIK